MIGFDASPLPVPISIVIEVQLPLRQLIMIHLIGSGGKDALDRMDPDAAAAIDFTSDMHLGVLYVFVIRELIGGRR